MGKQQQNTSARVVSSASESLEPTQQQTAGESESDDSSYDLEKDLASDSMLKLEQFSDEWVTSLDRTTKISLGLFVTFHLEKTLNLAKTEAAEYAAMMIGKSDRTVRKWRSKFLESGEISRDNQKKFQRSQDQQ